jgi:hypothetical protein
MKVVLTSDVSLPELRHFSNELRTELQVEVEDSQIFLRSAEPPSWVALLANADWWVKGLAAYAALFVAELVKEGAKETWRQRGKALAAATLVGGQLRRLGGAIAALRGRLSARTTIGIGLPVPNDYFTTRLALEGDEPDLLCAQLALFVHHLPALKQLLATHGIAEGGAATGVFLSLQDDGSLLVSWHEAETLKVREHVLPLRQAV